MIFKSKKIEVKYGKSHIDFDGQLIVTLHQYSSSNVSIVLGSTGHANHAFDMVLGDARSVSFDNPYEIRLLEFDTINATFLITELPLDAPQNTLFIASPLFEESEPEEAFSNEQMAILKQQLEALRSKVESVFDLNQEQAAFIKSSFDMLSKKLDQGAKANWKQAAYGVMTSIACSIPTDATQVGRFYDLVQKALTCASNLLGR